MNIRLQFIQNQKWTFHCHCHHQSSNCHTLRLLHTRNIPYKADLNVHRLVVEHGFLLEQPNLNIFSNSSGITSFLPGGANLARVRG